MAKVQSSTISYDQARSIVTSFGTKAREFANIILSIVGSNSSSFPKTTSFANNVLNLANHAGQWQNNPGLLTTQSRNAKQCYAEFRNSSNSHVLNSAVQKLQRLLDDTASAVDRMHNDREFLHNSENQNGGKLEHYGRLGMRWGMHIFGKEKAYRHAMNKLGRYDAKIDKNNKKSGRIFAKGIRENQRGKKEESYKLINKAIRNQGVSSKYRRKADKLVAAMNKEFANVTIDSFKPEDIAIGEKYVVDVLQRARNTSIRQGG